MKNMVDVVFFLISFTEKMKTCMYYSLIMKKIRVCFMYKVFTLTIQDKCTNYIISVQTFISHLNLLSFESLSDVIC